MNIMRELCPEMELARVGKVVIYDEYRNIDHSSCGPTLTVHDWNNWNHYKKKDGTAVFELMDDLLDVPEVKCLALAYAGQIEEIKELKRINRKFLAMGMISIGLLILTSLVRG